MRRLLIFLKYPTPGQVKTRLAATLGPEAAAEVYRACVELTLERLRPLASDATICVEPPSACDRVRAWVGSQWHVHPQAGEILGERLAYATDEAFQDGVREVVCVGTDSPWLTAPDIEAAFTALARAAVVIGPTEDGGYYLIGLSQPAPELFQGIAWSTPAVYEQTLRKIRALGFPIENLPMGYDIDQIDEVRRFVADELARGSHSTLLKLIDAVTQRREPCLS